MQIYLVGGAVRDQLLGLSPKERDWVVVGATPQEMLAKGFKQVGRDFPVFLHPETHEEYALARTERKVSPGYYGFQCDFDPGVTLEEDLLRRDLTLNAMARDDQDRLIDPHGGQQDLKTRLLRHVSPAFAEDPVRVLRLARFKAQFHHLGFQVADETSSLVYRMVKQHELEHLVPERVWQEWEKSFHTQHPAQFIWTLRQTGALAVILPELAALFGVPAGSRYHPEIDSGIHSLEVLEQARLITEQPEILFAALVHDVGKALTPKEKWPAHAGHDVGGEGVVSQLCDRLKVPNLYRDLATHVVRYHLKIHDANQLAPEAVLHVLVGVGAFRQATHLERLLQVCEADASKSGEPYGQRAFWLACLVKCSAIQTQHWVEQGWSGKQIQAALNQARLEAIRQVQDNDKGKGIEK